MKLLVFGGRDYADRATLFAVLDDYCRKYGEELIIIHGDCKTGADALADQWAKLASVDCLRVPARWSKYDKAAGPIRNERMLKRYQPDQAVQFPGGRGTRNMRGLLDEAGVPVHEVF